jgi:hypothetical protein
MKLKNTLLASALLSATALSANAATELTPEQAAALKPFDHTVIVGRYNSIGDAVAAATKAADKNGAASFYVVDQSDYGNSGNQRVTIALYKDDAPKADAPKTASLTASSNCQKIRQSNWNRTTPLPCRVSIAASLK